jgi:Holliday junction resolvase-like predicted endonuclease
MDPIQEILSKTIECGLYQGENQSPETFGRFLSIINQRMAEVPGERNNILFDIKHDIELHQKIRYYKPDWEFKSDITKVFCLIDNIYKSEFRNHYLLSNRIRNQEKKLSKTRSEKGKKIMMKKLSRCTYRSYHDVMSHMEQVLVELKNQIKTTEDKSVLKFLELKEQVDNYRRRWSDYNKTNGSASANKGKQFEKFKHQIIEKLGLPNAIYYPNVNWCDNWLIGEIDLLVHDLDKDEWIIVEQKSRIYDVYYGFKQNGCHRSSVKSWVIINGQKIDLDHDVKTYIVTTLPEHDFILPVETQLKEIISYCLKNSDLSLSEKYKYAQSKIPPDTLNPYTWYINGGYKNVLLINA